MALSCAAVEERNKKGRMRIKLNLVGQVANGLEQGLYRHYSGCEGTCTSFLIPSHKGHWWNDHSEGTHLHQSQTGLWDSSWTAGHLAWDWFQYSQPQLFQHPPPESSMKLLAFSVFLDTQAPLPGTLSTKPTFALPYHPPVPILH